MVPGGSVARRCGIAGPRRALVRDDPELPDTEGRARGARVRRIGRIEGRESGHVAVLIPDSFPQFVRTAPDGAEQEIDIGAAAMEDPKAAVAVARSDTRRVGRHCDRTCTPRG